MNDEQRRLLILGTRGIPAQHGGFETFAEHLALYLVENGWRVTVYCQDDSNEKPYEDTWRGVDLVHIPVAGRTAAATVIFDWRATLDAAKRPGLALVLGYNTAIFCAWLRLRGKTQLINMDGIEWRREKWGPFARAWLYLNERAGCLFGNHLIADNPGIAEHLARRVAPRRISMIPYGAEIAASHDTAVLRDLGVEPGRYALVIARPEPENSLLEIVRAFSAKPRNVMLVVLGRYNDANNYHRQVRSAASGQVVFAGAIYEAEKVQTLRRHGALYIHGHRVGGTNPSLVEAMGAALPVLANDNVFNRWVAGPEARYFTDASDCAEHLDTLLDDPALLSSMSRASAARHRACFQWTDVLASYETLFDYWLGTHGAENVTGAKLPGSSIP